MDRENTKNMVVIQENGTYICIIGKQKCKEPKGDSNRNVGHKFVGPNF